MIFSHRPLAAASRPPSLRSCGASSPTKVGSGRSSDRASAARARTSNGLGPKINRLLDRPGFDASQPDLDASPPKPDSEVRSDAADAREPGPADDCRPSELGAAPTVLVRPGAPALFSVDLGTAGPSWVSGCTGAFGPDRVVPVSVVGASRVVVSVDSTNDVTGNVVLYAKAQCGGPTDLACSATGRIEVPVSGSTPFFLHVDTVSAQPISARVTVFVETR